VRQITSRIDATASICETAEISAARAASSLESGEGVFEVTGVSFSRRRLKDFADDVEALHVSQGKVKAKSGSKLCAEDVPLPTG
jgi:hypothetical protein